MSAFNECKPKQQQSFEQVSPNTIEYTRQKYEQIINQTYGATKTQTVPRLSYSWLSWVMMGLFVVVGLWWATSTMKSQKEFNPYY